MSFKKINLAAHSRYLNTPFIVPGIKPRLKKIVSNLVSIKYMYKRGTKPGKKIFTFDFIPGTKNGVLRYIMQAKLHFICILYIFLYFSCKNRPLVFLQGTNN